MVYVWIKAVHAAAGITWIGGLLMVAVTVAAVSGRGAGTGRAGMPLLGAIRTWDRRVTAPAMVLGWGLGLTLTVQGGWFSGSWLAVKLVLVVILSAIHGASGRLRRLVAAPERGAGPVSVLAAPLVLGMTAAIVVLVIVKPL